MFEITPNTNNVLFFNGPFTMSFISFVANYLYGAMNTDHIVSKRVFKVFVELIQNVALYSAETRKSLRDPDARRGVGCFSIDEFDDYFLVGTGNLILREHASILKKNCKEINSSNQEELRKLKRKTRSQASLRDVGPHIGLIQIGLLSGNPLDISFQEADKAHYYFKIKVKIDKIHQ